MSRLASLVAVALVLLWPSLASAQPRLETGTDGRSLPEPPAVRPTFTIAILGDRTTGRPWGIPYLERAVEDLNRIGPDVVFSIGDMVQGYTRSMERFDDEVDEFLEIVGRLEAPFYPLAGNHDVISGMRDPSDRRFEERYRERFGPLYYAAHFDLLSVLVLYTEEALQSRPVLSDRQVEWAVRQIDDAASRGSPLVLLMHKPAWRYRESNWEPIHERLAEARRGSMGWDPHSPCTSSGIPFQPVPVIVIAGHFHSLQRDPDRDGVEYHIIGTCGGMIDQHPLGGHLQHVSILRARQGEVYLYHQPVGTTLPDDFVLAADQERVFTLKQSREVVVVETVLDQPINHPVRETVVFRLTNPIDVPITISGELVTKPPTESLVPGHAFVGRTFIDMHNPFVTRVDTPVRQLRPMEPVTLGPGESREVEIELRCEAQGRMIPPPQFDFTAVFEDGHGREVPVAIRRRLPLRMRHVLREHGAMDLRACSWEFDVYDRLKPDPEIGLSVHQDHLVIAITARDDVPCWIEVDDPRVRVENPLSDAALVRFGRGEQERLFLFEPMGPADAPAREAIRLEEEPRWALEPSPRVKWEAIVRPRGWALIVQIPLEKIGPPGSAVPFNIEIADNDETYHTQWRRWSHPRAGSTIVLPQR